MTVGYADCCSVLVRVPKRSSGSLGKFDMKANWSADTQFRHQHAVQMVAWHLIVQTDGTSVPSRAGAGTGTLGRRRGTVSLARSAAQVHVQKTT